MSIAFVLNVPMNFFQRHLFPKEKLEKNKTLKKLEKPVSLIISLTCVIGVIGLVMFVVIPQLKNTFVNLGQSIQAFIPQIQEWARIWFADNPDMFN